MPQSQILIAIAGNPLPRDESAVRSKIAEIFDQITREFPHGGKDYSFTVIYNRLTEQNEVTTKYATSEACQRGWQILPVAGCSKVGACNILICFDERACDQASKVERRGGTVYRCTTHISRTQ